MILLFVTCAPHTQKAWNALDCAKSHLERGKKIGIFFYGDGAYTANRLRWQPADVADVADEWVKLGHQYDIKLPVCVSTALARGITDHNNAIRHHLSCDGVLTDNVKEGFELVGLSSLALMIDESTTLLQF